MSYLWTVENHLKRVVHEVDIGETIQGVCTILIAMIQTVQENLDNQVDQRNRLNQAVLVDQVL